MKKKNNPKKPNQPTNQPTNKQKTMIKSKKFVK